MRECKRRKVVRERERGDSWRTAGKKRRGAKGDRSEVGWQAAVVLRQIKFPRLP